MLKKRVLIINTGGTISSVKTTNGYVPVQRYTEQALAEIKALSHPEMPQYFIKEYEPLLDSSNMTVKDWNTIAEDIGKNYEYYDGFVIFHGTDTMAFTASALSFMLENLQKPVILTGSQIPLSEIRNDAVDNVITSLWICAHHPISEVCIYFNGRLLRGNRAQKVSSNQFKAFDSPSFPQLAAIGIQIEMNQSLFHPWPSQSFSLQKITPHFIANFRLFPGFSTKVLDYILQQPLEGLILETYGAGNAQNNDPLFLEILSQACSKGVIIVNCSQCLQGYVAMDQYATGFSLKEAGLISGYDMTPEAAHCKLLYLLSKYKNLTQVKMLFEENICGELTRVC